MRLRILAFGSLLTLHLATYGIAAQPARPAPAPANAHRSPTSNPYRPPAAATRSAPTRTAPTSTPIVRSSASNAPPTDASPTVETPHLDRTLAETGRLPIVARGDLRDEIKSLDINERPHRPLHFYGNAVRRRTGAAPAAN